MGLSVCMIGRNEEENIPRSLASARLVADEIVFVDTGSTDRTVEIAESFGAVVISTKWRDNFAYARNISLRMASHQWIMWMDCDDEIPPESAKSICSLKPCVPNGVRVFMVENVGCVDESIPKLFAQARMFPNFRGVQFEGRIHEVIGKCTHRLGLADFDDTEEIRILHHGYADSERLHQKIVRNHRCAILNAYPSIKDESSLVCIDMGRFIAFYAPYVLWFFDGRNASAPVEIHEAKMALSFEEFSIVLSKAISDKMAEALVPKIDMEALLGGELKRIESAVLSQGLAIN